jgi:hypothetical protein
LPLWAADAKEYLPKMLCPKFDGKKFLPIKLVFAYQGQVYNILPFFDIACP